MTDGRFLDALARNDLAPELVSEPVASLWQPENDVIPLVIVIFDTVVSARFIR
jgi:hypothetical protein